MAIQLGTFLKIASPQVVEILAGAGFDFVVLDAEHAPFDRRDMDIAVLAARATALDLFVRVPEIGTSAILNALDLGAAGILAPHVDSAADARLLMELARYRGGRRGYSNSTRASGFGNLGREAALAAGDATLIISQIESPAAVDQVDEILKTPGLGGLMVGRADLAVAMGLSGPDHPEVIAATERVLGKARQAGLIAGVAAGSRAEGRRFEDAGANWIIIGSDLSLMRSGARMQLEQTDRN